MSGRAVVAALEELGLKGMAAAWQRQEAARDRRGANVRLAEALDLERAERTGKATSRRLARARLPQGEAALEDVWEAASRGLRRSQLQALARLTWVKNGASLAFVGATGTGKTWLACAYANAALAAGYTVEVWTVPDLLAEWHRFPENILTLRRRLARVELLVLDEWGGEALRPGDTDVLRRIVLSRLHAKPKSLLLTSARPMSGWRAWLGSSLEADSLVDQLENGTQVLQFQGASLRRRRAAVM